MPDPTEIPTTGSAPVPIIPIPDDPGEPEYTTPPDDDDGPGVGDEYPDEPHDV